MPRNSQADQQGRTDQKVGLLNPRQQATLILTAGAVATAACWHVTVVLLAGVPAGQVNVTIRALMKATPLSGLGPQYPAPSATAALLVWVGLLTLVVGAWLTLRLWWSSRRGPRAVGLADRRQTRRSAGEVRARELAGYTRRASVESGQLDPDTCDLTEVGFDLGRTRDDHEPVVITLEDQLAVFAPTGGGKSLHLMIPGCIDAAGPAGGHGDVTGDPGRHRGAPLRNGSDLGVRPAGLGEVAGTDDLEPGGRRAELRVGGGPRAGVHRRVLRR